MKKDKYFDYLVRLTGVVLGTKADADVAVATAARALTLAGKEVEAAQARGEIRAGEESRVSRGPVRKLSNEELLEIVGEAKDPKQVLKEIRMKTGCTRETAYTIIKRGKAEGLIIQANPTDAIRPKAASNGDLKTPAPAGAVVTDR